MEQIKELTKKLISNSFKELMLEFSFEKITIKMITDHANVIRPTFYNHFHDKYELVEWILKDEITEPVRELVLQGKLEDGISFIFKKFYEDREYYRKAFEITGQNGFTETVTGVFTEFFLDLLSTVNWKGDDTFMTAEVVCRYYTSGLISMIHMEIDDADHMSVDKYISTYKYLMQHTIYEFLK